MTDDLNISTAATFYATRDTSSSPVSLRRRMPNGTLSRAQIIDATATCLAQHGYDGTTIRTLARMLGCAVGSIYRYFPDKRSLLLEVVQRPLRGLAAACGPARPLRDGVELYLDVVMRNPAAYQLLFWLWSMQDREPYAGNLPPVIQQIVDAWSQRLGSDAAGYSLWTRVHGVATLADRRRLEALAAELEAPLPPRARVAVTAPARAVAEDVCLL